MSEPTVFLNGRFVPYDQALIPVEDRGFLFADGIYEVIACYNGQPFRLSYHLQRLRASAEAIEIQLPYDDDELTDIVLRLLAINKLQDASIYLQVTRGVAPRNHLFPEGVTPTVVGIARPYSYPRVEDDIKTIVAVTMPDTRWALCHVKSIGLLPNILARQAAYRQGADEAIFVRNGLITEGSSSNVFCVLDDIVYTHPLDNVLAGITRQTLLEIMDEQAIPYREEPVPVEQFVTASEIFVTSTRQGVVAVTRVDGKVVGDGHVGPISEMLGRAYRRKAIAETSQLGTKNR